MSHNHVAATCQLSEIHRLVSSFRFTLKIIWSLYQIVQSRYPRGMCREPMNFRKLARRSYMVMNSYTIQYSVNYILVTKQSVICASYHGVYLALLLLNPVPANGLQLYWNPANYSLAIAMSFGGYEKNTSRLFINLLHRGMVVLDLGANNRIFFPAFCQVRWEGRKRLFLDLNPTNCDIWAEHICKWIRTTS